LLIASLLLKTKHKLLLIYQKFLSSFNRSTPFPRTRLLRPRGRNVDRQLALHLRPPLPEAEEHGMQKFDFRGNDSNLQVRARDPADPARSFDRARSRLRRKRSRRTSFDFELQDEILHQRKKGKVVNTMFQQNIYKARLSNKEFLQFYYVFGLKFYQSLIAILY